jgi:hypothetical protein
MLGTRQLIAGMALLALAMSCALVLLTSVLFHTTEVVLVAAGSAVLFGWLWFGLGLLKRLRGTPEW